MTEMGYLIIIGILIISLIVVLIVFINKPKDNFDLLKQYLKAENSEFQLQVLKLLGEQTNSQQSELLKNITNQFEFISRDVNSKINDNFKKTDQTFVSVVERLTKIDEQNKNITNLSKEVLTLNQILTNKSTRGTFGEVQLYQLLEASFGKNKQMYTTQTRLSNGKIPDATIFAPKPLGNINIDAKFPLDNYQKYQDNNLSKEEVDKYVKLFKNDLKNHIKTISEKYIINGETASYAIMFIPAETIYLEIVNNHFEIINYGYEANVFITSPTTLIASLSVIEAVSTSVRQNEQTHLLVDELKYLANEFRKYKDRSDALENRLKGLVKDFDDLLITNRFIYKRFIEIEQGKID